MTVLQERKQIMSYIFEAVDQKARKKQACDMLGISVRTVQRWEKHPKGDQRLFAIHKSSIALTEDEEKKITEICNSKEFRDMNPNQIVPILAERGEYYASESTFYRILKKRELLNHRNECKLSKPRKAPDELKATGPNQVWSWDITYLKSAVKGIFFYLYLFMDVWSRKIVGWTVEESEDSEMASHTISRICTEQKISSIYLHSDNGGPMKSGTMLATLQNLGVVPSFSRARVSNDNPFSESLFKTMKYVPAYPKEFKSINDAREWVDSFVNWYNTEHHHSGIKFVTPQERHNKEDILKLHRRKETYIVARNRNPKRWSGKIRNWDYIREVVLNKKVEKIKFKKIA